MASGTNFLTMGCLSLSRPPPGVSTSLPSTPLRGLGLYHSSFLPEAEEALWKAPPFTDASNRQRWPGNPARPDHTYLAAQQLLSPLSPVASNANVCGPSCISTDLVPRITTSAATYPTKAASFEHPYLSGRGSFNTFPYRAVSSPDYQVPCYEPRSTSVAEPLHSWSGFEPQSGYPVTESFSPYSTPQRMVSPTASYAIPTGSAPESPSYAAEAQFEARAGTYMGSVLGADSAEGRSGTDDLRALSWPGDSDHLEQMQQLDRWEAVQSNEGHLANSRRAPRLRRNISAPHSREGQGRRADGANRRVVCSFSDGCRRTFNRKTDMDRHITTVHLRTRDKRCPFCGYGFGRWDILTRHLKGTGCPCKPSSKELHTK